MDTPAELACGLSDTSQSNFLEPAHGAPAASAAGMPALYPPYSTPLQVLSCPPATRAPRARSVWNPGQTSAQLPAAQGHACASPPAHTLVRVRVYAGGIQHVPGAQWHACPAPGLRFQVPLRRRGAGAPHGSTNPYKRAQRLTTSTATPGIARASRAACSKTHISLLVLSLRAPRPPARSTGSAHHASKHQTGFPTLTLKRIPRTAGGGHVLRAASHAKKMLKRVSGFCTAPRCGQPGAGQESRGARGGAHQATLAPRQGLDRGLYTADCGS